jgi:hypothetical protein
MARDNNVQAFLVGAAANQAVENQLTSLGLKYETVTAANDFELANQIGVVYGKIQNPPPGVPQMEGSATFGGKGRADRGVREGGGDRRRGVGRPLVCHA